MQPPKNGSTVRSGPTTRSSRRACRSGRGRWLDDLRRRFLDRPDEWNRPPRTDFFEKLERLLVDSPPEVYQLMGEVIYVSYLVVSCIARARWNERAVRRGNVIEQVLGWSPEAYEAMPDDCADGLSAWPRTSRDRIFSRPTSDSSSATSSSLWSNGRSEGQTRRLLEAPRDAEAAWEFKRIRHGRGLARPAAR